MAGHWPEVFAKTRESAPGRTFKFPAQGYQATEGYALVRPGHSGDNSLSATHDRELIRLKQDASELAPTKRETDALSGNNDEFVFRHPQAIWTPCSAQDITIHYELDVVDDVPSLLEEFARLKRLGRFEVAEEFFEKSLAEFASLLPVLLEYADMRIEQGLYERVRHIKFPRDMEDLSLPTVNVTEKPSAFLYHANLALIQAFAAIQFQGCMSEAYASVRALETPMRKLRRYRRREHLPLDSAEVQVFRYALKILWQVERDSNLIPEHHFDFWSNGTDLYPFLLAEGRVWDARDLMIASIEADGAANTWKWIFDLSIFAHSSFSRLLDDWNSQQYDEPTALALLDILVTVSQQFLSYAISTPSEHDLSVAHRSLQHAEPLVAMLRSYCRWVTVKAELGRKRQGQDKMSFGLENHLSKFPGLTIWSGAVPIYLPIKTENPGWTPEASITTSSHIELYDAVSRMHRFGDYATEALCRAELLHHCSPLGAMQQLVHLADLQITTQGDRFGYHKTCLAKFLFTSTSLLRQSLLADLRLTPSTRISFSFPGLTAWCIATVERALLDAENHQERAVHQLTLQQAAAGDVALLPQYIQDRLRNGLDRMYGLDCGPREKPSTLALSPISTKPALKYGPTFTGQRSLPISSSSNSGSSDDSLFSRADPAVSIGSIPPTRLLNDDDEDSSSGESFGTADSGADEIGRQETSSRRQIVTIEDVDEDEDRNGDINKDLNDGNVGNGSNTGDPRQGPVR
ncbi:uncharacterized protein BO95DRAFT_490166 [Aspergillus brunneoviolaceus CBS 621.78]|uniref:Uncharacterized protein n=1 Tax=Aspergillus brunneoviolaceus CBS 621.78 TaxID=1450534 RepID=A0ACD1GHL5_9EURO|nr:hypothetical protein BO95DRAFT_490166 [Aspergillus brunneoviolaceus CBS 621.78]RAH48741.1 hypothetical protein BO95DRAFT_490166 [Aspergillus brunneoviolaceus CBS 621.78]